MANRHCLFREVRVPAFQFWQRETRRDCSFVNDDMTQSYECRWQDRATFEMGYEHISIFCSLGEWANNVSDILKNHLYDCYDLLDDDYRQALFRYYTRLLLVISEMLCDFEDIIQKVKSVKSKPARELLSNSRGEIDSLLGYINTVCKHKVEAIHRCNHHLPIWFEDCGQSHSFEKPVSIYSLDFASPDGIVVPRLDYFVQVIVNCYAHLDAVLETDDKEFRTICDEYDGRSYLE